MNKGRTIAGKTSSESSLRCALQRARALFRVVFAAAWFFTSFTNAAAPGDLTTTYLGNEGIMVAQGGTKIVFDPLYQNTYNTYQSVPAATREALLNAQPPFDDLKALFVSHSHGDHFSASDLMQFMAAHPTAVVVAPTQAIDALREALRAQQRTVADSQLVSISLDYGAAPLAISVGDIKVEAVRIAHAGGAERRSIENILYRVTLPGEAVVMHMGDADPSWSHYRPYKEHWQSVQTDAAFPPYWFFTVPEGKQLLAQRLNSVQQTGVHTPVDIPQDLIDSGADYFSRSGEQRVVKVAAKPASVSSPVPLYKPSGRSPKALDIRSPEYGASSSAPAALSIDAKVPDFVVPRAGGGDISLADLRAHGLVAIVFYRGHW